MSINENSLVPGKLVFLLFLDFFNYDIISFTFSLIDVLLCFINSYYFYYKMSNYYLYI